MPRLGKVAFVSMLVLVLALPSVAQKKKKIKAYPPFALHKNLVVDLQPMPQVVAKQKCGNWAWAAALEAALRGRGVALDQTFWILRLNNGEVCLDSAGTPEDLIRYLEREPRVLSDGRKVQFHVVYVPGPPTAMDAMIRSIQQNEPIIVYWRGRARILSGLTYDENVASTGDHIFDALEVRMIDPYAAPTDPARVVKFDKATDSLADFGGAMFVQVVPAP